MSENTPAAAAAATPAVLPLTQEEIEFLRQFKDSDPQNVRFTPHMIVRLLATLDAAVAQRDAAELLLKHTRAQRNAYEKLRDEARADLAEFARQTREAQASLLVAIKDREQERQQNESLERHVLALENEVDDLRGVLAQERQAREKAELDYENGDALGNARMVEVEDALDAAVARADAERNRRRWAETRASHWRRQEDLVMIRLAQRSNELGRANLAHRTALDAERQARAEAEQRLQEEIRVLLHYRAVLDKAEAALVHERQTVAHLASESLRLGGDLVYERACGERLAEALASLVAVADAYVQDFEDGDKQDALFECLQKAATVLLAAPASPAAEPADPTTAIAAQAEGA